ncbi:MAG: sugar transferase [Candidatus Acetothermia bacterium]|nr:sugar transferase [Candidatus Acetothermia bacterium]
MKPQGWYRSYRKRSRDVILSILALATLLPIAPVVASVILVSMGSPVLFRQVRPGLHGRPFTPYKFRTMIALHDKQGNLLPDEQRLTQLGRRGGRRPAAARDPCWDPRQADEKISMTEGEAMKELVPMSKGAAPHFQDVIELVKGYSQARSRR